MIDVTLRLHPVQAQLIRRLYVKQVIEYKEVTEDE